MGIDVKIVGADTHTGALTEVPVHKHHDGPPGMLVHTVAHTRFSPLLHPFLNPTVGVNMNQNVGFSGTPDKIHRGTDGTTLWTGSNISGTNVTFNQDDEHAHGGVITVVDFTSIAGATVTVGLNGSDTVYTEGVEWVDTTGNNETATSLASAISATTGVTATASSAVVTVVADFGFSITKIDTSDAGDLPGTAQAVKIDGAAVGDIWEFDKTIDLTIANYTAITGWIYIDDRWAEGDSIEIYCYDTDSSSEVGVRVPIEDFTNFINFDVWQSFAIPFSILDIAGAGTFDAVRFQVAAKSGSPPRWFLDDLQVEQTGTPVTFTTVTPKGTRFHITELRLRIETVLDNRLANSSVPNLTFGAILNVARLANGIAFRRVQRGKTLFSAVLRDLSDFLATGSNIIDILGDGTNTGFTLLISFPVPVVLEGDDGENFMSFTISDDLSGLSRFTAVARGAEEI